MVVQLLDVVSVVVCMFVRLDSVGSILVQRRLDKTYVTSIKNNCLMKSEVGMAVLKSKQTRVVGIINTYV